MIPACFVFVTFNSVSLVPRPFPPPVFDRLHANTMYLHTASHQVLAVGMAWGVRLPSVVCNLFLYATSVT